MDGLSLQTSPFSPFLESSEVSESLHSPYKGEERIGGDFGDAIRSDFSRLGWESPGAINPVWCLVHDDYQRFLAEYSLDEARVSAVVADMRDHVQMPTGFDSFAIGRSLIHGRGLFCTLPVPEGKPVAMARVGVCRTVAGRLTNHSPLPNCRFESIPNGLVMVARRTLTPAEELTVDYRQVASVNGWKLQPVLGEVVTTLRWRALALRRIGDPWARWCEASDAELTREAEHLLNRFGHLPSIDVTTAEKQSKEIK
jgi:hypothetical protein